jgi:prophage regulatory protein
MSIVKPLLKIKTVCEITSLSKSTVYRLISEKEFPLPVQISSRRVGWREEDIDSFLDSLSAK